MASKKCPKCGEDNPAEAVMCWACYTPLSGSAPLGAGLAAGAAVGTMPKTAGAPMGVPPSNDEPAKKGIDPKVIGVGAFLLIGGVVAVMMSGLLGGGGDSGAMPGGVDPTAPVADPAPAPAPAPGGVAPPISTGPVASGGAAPAPVPIPFKTIASPGAGFKTGTLGILVTGNAASPAGAAKFAKNQFAKNGNWTNMQVAVFTDQQTADAFGTYQRNRKNAPLTSADFKALAEQGVWNNTPAFLDARGKSEKVYTPSSSPLSWWPGR